MPILFIPVGIPGCGKSSWAEGICSTVVSTDAIRAELTGDPNVQDQNGRVFEIFYRRIEYHLRMGWSTYADATNLDRNSRSDLRRVAASLVDGRTHLVLFRNLSQAITNNLKRERVVPHDVMMRMIEKYERVIMDIPSEKYDYVTEVSAIR